MATLAEIRAKLKAEGEKGSGNRDADNSVYPHWNIPDSSTATLRFLPDGDSKNDYFWVERNMIKLPFPSIKGQRDSKPLTIQIPCVEMWNETCPILTEVRTWFKDKSLEDMGRKYWKKRSYLFQGFVIDSPLQEEAAPENAIRRFLMGPQIFNIIKSALMDPEMEELPTDYKRGIDFRVTKGAKGGYADYGTSTWARRERPLSEVEMAAIEKHGLHDLKDFLPKKPTEDELKLMKEMFEASVNGDAFDNDKFGAFNRGYSKKAEGATDSAPAETPKPKVSEPTTETVSEATTETKMDVSEPKKPSSNARAEDILKMIRDRQTK
jgi:hypothetical protein